MNLDTLIRDQNPYWADREFRPPEAEWYHRPAYQQTTNWLKKQIVISLTGLRRVGKSTIMKQIIGDVLTAKIAPEQIFYFSFDQSIIKRESETLRSILETFASSVLHHPLSAEKKPLYVFLDEIQIVPQWQEIIKTYYDTNPSVHFVVSGSASLFVSRTSTESLAGRLAEITVPPLSFLDYLNLNQQAKQEISKIGLEKYSLVFPEYVTAFFQDYLAMGQFPQPVSQNYSPIQFQQYIQTIEDKIIDIDLPQTFSIERPDILKIIFEYFKTASGTVVSYENLTNDLGIDIRTTIKYVEWLQKAYLFNLCHNQTKKLVKSSRTSKKVYLASTNFLRNAPLGNQVETYVFNVLKGLNVKLTFFRFKDQEIDFITTTPSGQKIPWEVKYQAHINNDDEKQVRNFADRNQSPYAFLLTKQSDKQDKHKSTTLYHIPVSCIEQRIEALREKLI